MLLHPIVSSFCNALFAMNVKKVNLSPAELSAILEHRRRMSLNLGQECSLEQAIEHFILHVRNDWLKQKLREDGLAQRQEIEKHKYYRSQDAGHDVGKAAAAEEWCAKYAHIWRQERESLERNGFVRIELNNQSPHDVILKPGSALAQIAEPFQCEMYLHRPAMDYYNFILNGKRYMNVKSVLGLLSVAIAPGESFELIATGPDARLALNAVSEWVNQQHAPTATHADSPAT